MKVLVIGAGYWGEKLLERFLGLTTERNVLVAESNPDRLASISERYRVKTALDYTGLLGEADACVVATPIETHFELSGACLTAGKHVLTEKPAATGPMVWDLLNEAQRRNLTFMADHTFLYTDYMLRTFPAEKPRPLVDWVQANWQNPRQSSPDESVLWTLAPHPVSLALHILARAPNGLLAQVGREHALLEYAFPGGGEAHLTASWTSPIRSRRLRIGIRNEVVDINMDHREEPDALTNMATHFLKRVETPPFLDWLAGEVVDALWQADNQAVQEEEMWQSNGH